MNILFSGASSFSGMWFARALARQGHSVSAVFRGRGERDYSGIRLRRVKMLDGLCRRVFGCVFGGAPFLRLAAEKPGWDVFCHHAAAVGDFRAADYNVASALAANTRNLPQVFDTLQSGGCRMVLLTGSVFESGEGKGSDGLPAVLPYGLAKSLTWQSFVFYARQCGMRLGKFVIANPFGPLEEARFTAHLAQEWLAQKSALVRTPEYVRDNIHISLLAAEYAGFVCKFAEQKK
ncbi:MAG: NAD-dependent epimerase/dehydratase family protein, partial [Gammaproteobacteria bacterium]